MLFDSDKSFCICLGDGDFELQGKIFLALWDIWRKSPIKSLEVKERWDIWRKSYRKSPARKGKRDIWRESPIKSPTRKEKRDI